jgi:putative ABC transport system permease protein
VAAVVSVAGISRALDDGVRAQARQLLAADVAVSSGRPIADGTIDAIDGIRGARRAETREFPSVVSGPSGESVLCEIKAVTADYPFYGTLVLDPPAPLAAALGDDRVVVGPELLTRLGIRVGDKIRLGGATFEVAGMVAKEPDRIGVSFTLGPRVFVSFEGLERSGLVGLGSRIEHRVLVALAPGSTVEDVASAAATIRAAIPDPAFVDVETYVEAQPALRSGIERVDRFLGLIALLSLLVGGIGVAQAVRAWLASRLDAIAVLRALGARPREVFALYLGQTAVLGAFGSLAGALAGALVARLLPAVLGGVLPIEVVVGWQPAAMLRGIALGVGVALLFALRPLADVLRVPPVRVLRRDADPLPADRRAVAALATVLVLGVAAIASFQAGSVVRGAEFTVGLLVAGAFLSAGAWAVVRLTGRVPRELGSVALRHGLAALARPGAGTLGAVVALGLGVLTVVGMALVQQRLSAQLDAELPRGAPTVFLVDIQPDQWNGVRNLLEQADARNLDSVEVVVARLQAIDGVPIADLVPDSEEDSGRRRWVLTREQRLTSMATLPEGNVVVDGSLWADPDRAEVSVERDFAADLGVGVGSTLTFDVQGVPLELLVSSIRTVEWKTFAINFFLVVEPGVLDDAPRFRIAAARLAADAERPLQDRLAAAYPNVTVLRIREVLEKVLSILEQVGFGVRLLGGFTVLAGIAILAGAVSAGAVRRARDVARYKTLGMTRGQVVAAFGVEYALVGVVAGTIGVAGAVALAWTVVRFGFEMDWAWTPVVYAAAVLVTTVLSVLAGLAASARALAVRPLEVLRRET